MNVLRAAAGSIDAYYYFRYGVRGCARPELPVQLATAGSASGAGARARASGPAILYAVHNP